MARVIISPLAEMQIGGCRDFYHDAALGLRALKTVLAAFKPLARYPAIGRPVPEDPSLRELVIPFGHYGYLALYKYIPDEKVVTILAVRHQRQAGYGKEEDG